jgi:SAM-dependent methyltransferase
MNPSFACNYCRNNACTVVSDGIRDWEYGVPGTYAYLQCTRCEGVQLSPFPGLEDLKRAYDIDYHGYALGQRRGPVFSLLYRTREWLFRRQMGRLVDAQSRVLDVGCGQGDFLRSLKSLGVRRLEGIDFSPDMIEALKSQGIDGYCGTFPDFEGAGESYDLIAMNNYLEHTLDPVQELAKAHELLAPGSYLIGEVPGFDSWERQIFGRYWGGNHVPRHTYQFSARFLLKVLQEAGYEEIRISHQLNTSHLALSVQNVLQRNRENLAENPGIEHGRSWYYVPLLLLFIPVNAVCVLSRRSGCLRFRARKSISSTRND